MNTCVDRYMCRKVCRYGNGVGHKYPHIPYSGKFLAAENFGEFGEWVSNRQNFTHHFFNISYC